MIGDQTSLLPQLSGMTNNAVEGDACQKLILTTIVTARCIGSM